HGAQNPPVFVLFDLRARIVHVRNPTRRIRSRDGSTPSPGNFTRTGSSPAATPVVENIRALCARGFGSSCKRTGCVMVMGGDDRGAVMRQVQAVQSLEGEVAVVVGETAGKGGLLADLLDLQGMPGGIARQQNPAAPGVGEDADAAGGVAGE